MNISNAALDISSDIEFVSGNAKCPNQDCRPTYTTKNKSNFNKHIKSMHPQPTSMTLKSSLPAVLRFCDTRGKTFKSHFGLNLHIKNKHTKYFIYIYIYIYINYVPRF